MTKRGEIKRTTMAYDLRFSTDPPMAYRDIASRMNCSINTVGVLLNQAGGTRVQVNKELTAGIERVMRQHNLPRSKAVRIIIRRGLEALTQDQSQCPSPSSTPETPSNSR